MISRLTFALVLGLLGCEGAPPADKIVRNGDDGPPIQTDSTRYVLRFDDPGWMADIGFSCHADSDTVYIVNCNGAILMNLQKLVSGEWTDAWYAEGDACLSPPIVVPPNGEFRGEIAIWGAHPASPSYNSFRVSEIDGEYRLVWHQPVHHYQPEPGRFGDTIHLDRRISNPFTLVQLSTGP